MKNRTRLQYASTITGDLKSTRSGKRLSSRSILIENSPLSIKKESLLTTSQIVNRFKINRTTLYWKMKIGRIRPKQEIRKGRAVNLYEMKDVLRLVGLKEKSGKPGKERN